MNDPVSVTYYVDSAGQDCYRVCVPEHDVCSTVASAHLIEERKVQLLRRYPTNPSEQP